MPWPPDDALRAVQVKDTSANVTINSQDIRDALDAFVDLVARNPGRKIHLHFLSTSSVGKEQRPEHRANGEPTLLYWRSAAAAADIQPLREALAKLSFPTAYGHSSMHVTTNAAEGIPASHSLGLRPAGHRWRAARIGKRPSSLSRAPFPGSCPRDQLAAAVVQRCLMTIIQGGDRRLTDADLLALVTDTSYVLVARPDFETAMRGIGAALAGGVPEPQSRVSISRASWSPSRTCRSHPSLPSGPM